MPLTNKEKRNMNISMSIALIGLMVTVWPFILQADMMAWGFAAVTLGGFVCLSGLVAVAAFKPRAQAMDRILTGENLMAHWTYGPSHKEALNEEAREDVGMMRVASGVLGGIFIVIGLVLYVVDPDENGLFLGIMGGVAASQLAARSRNRFISQEDSDAYFDRNGVYYAGGLTTWARPFSRLRGVTVDPRAPETLIIAFLQLHGRMPHFRMVSLQIPVPPGRSLEAQALASAYAMPPDAETLAYIDSLFQNEE
jgi:hypothetical protein